MIFKIQQIKTLIPFWETYTIPKMILSQTLRTQWKNGKITQKEMKIRFPITKN